MPLDLNLNSNFNFPEKSSRFLIPGPLGDQIPLELALDYPRENIKHLPIIFIMCHPNPLEGGTMDNKVVTTSIKAMNKLGVLGLRFNFRGVGESLGDYGNTAGESEDLLEIINWVKKSKPDYDIWLGGFSFGSYIAYKLAGQLDLLGFYPEQLLTIAPAVTRWDYTKLNTPDSDHTNWLCLIGDQDEVVNIQDVFNFVSGVNTQSTLIKFKNTGHFFHQRLIKLDQVLTQYYSGVLSSGVLNSR